MSSSLYGFVKGREPVTPEEVARELFSPLHNGDARARVEGLVADDPRFLWDETGYLRIADATALSLEDAPFVVFDVETTGSSAKEGAITEIGALKVVRGQLVDEFATLVNPGRPIQPFVVRLTGITDRMVADAPNAAEVMPLFEDFAEGCVLVGHNVHFDCSFVSAAREASGLAPLPNPVLDTLKLARSLVPGLKRYRLSSLVSHFGVRAAPNHRALADAAATAEVFLKLLKLLRSAGVWSVGEAVTLRSGSRARIEPQKGHLAEDLPRGPGVYYFVDKHGTTLYVGKAKDLKARVRTYFNGGDGRRKIGRLVREIAEVRYKETQSELHALVFEDREIKRLLPRYNSAGRGEERARWFIKLDLDEPYPVPERVHGDDRPNGATYLGPYRSANVLDTCIEALGRIFPLRRCIGGSEDGVCFYGQMGRCAPCLGMGEEEYRAEVIGEITALLRGEGGEEHLEALVGERERLAGELEFESAARLPTGLTLFAEEVLGAQDDAAVPSGGGSADEARIVSAYLRRRQVAVEAVRLRESADLVNVAGKVAGRAAEVGEKSGT
ncbi:MAG: DEDD exonuclease domain-containing protein [Actinobacteria bacterium]|nr:DEDD exonuclease domain-containing protein [Actinomycetota bacterium]